MTKTFVLVYAKDSKIKVLLNDDNQLLSDGWTHTATLDACRWIEWLHNNASDKSKEINDLHNIERYNRKK